MPHKASTSVSTSTMSVDPLWRSSNKPAGCPEHANDLFARCHAPIQSAYHHTGLIRGDGDMDGVVMEIGAGDPPIVL